MSSSLEIRVEGCGRGRYHVIPRAEYEEGWSNMRKGESPNILFPKRWLYAC